MAYDYIIVGGGPAGCVLANRLSEDAAVEVLLLEAGGSDRHPYFAMPAGFAKMTKGIASWGWSTVPQTHLGGRVLRYTQAKVIGGGSSINAQIYTRGNPRDYDGWVRDEGCEGWSYRDVLPYFRRAEDNQRFADEFHASGGPLGVSVPINPLPISEAFLRAAQEFGMPYNPDFNGARQAGVGHYQVTVRDARRSSASVAYLRPIRSRRNLTVETGQVVTRILVEGHRAVGVERVGQGGSRLETRCDREVLVTSGGIGSPRLLLLSGIGPADHLKTIGVEPVHDLPGVGANLQDHLDLFAIAECTGDHTYDAMLRPHRAAMAGLQYLLTRQGPVASTLFETGGFWSAGDEPDWPDIQFHLGLGSGIEAGVDKLKNAGVTLNSAYLRPRSRGTVRLAFGGPCSRPADRPELLGRSARPHPVPARPRGGTGHPGAARPKTLHPGRTDARTGHRGRGRTDRLRPAHLQDRPPPLRHLQDGARRPRRRVAGPHGARARRPAGLRQLGDAADHLIEHQCADHHGGREGSRYRQGAPAAGGAQQPGGGGGVGVNHIFVG